MEKTDDSKMILVEMVFVFAKFLEVKHTFGGQLSIGFPWLYVLAV